MIKPVILAMATAAGVLGSASAHAGGHVSWSVGINVPPVGVVVGAPAYPAYSAYPVYAPAPVYAEPAPVYAPIYEPAPVYYRPAPVVYAPPAYYYPRHRVHYRPVPVVAPYPYRHWR